MILNSELEKLSFLTPIFWKHLAVLYSILFGNFLDYKKMYIFPGLAFLSAKCVLLWNHNMSESEFLYLYSLRYAEYHEKCIEPLFETMELKLKTAPQPIK